MQRLGAVGRCTRAVTQGAEPGPSSEGSGRFQDSSGAGDHTGAKPAYLHSRKPFMGAGGRQSRGQEEELPEGGGCVALGAQSARL